MSTYNPDLHGKTRLGYCPLIPVVPDVPQAAQLCTYRPALHLQLAGGGYVVVSGQGVITPSVGKALHTMFKAGTLELENSYSGSQSKYARLTVVDQDGDVLLKAGDLVVCKVKVDPTVEMVSGDEGAPTEGANEHDGTDDE